jgi:hypothetical protein
VCVSPRRAFTSPCYAHLPRERKAARAYVGGERAASQKVRQRYGDQARQTAAAVRSVRGHSQVTRAIAVAVAVAVRRSRAAVGSAHDAVTEDLHARIVDGQVLPRVE